MLLKYKKNKIQGKIKQLQKIIKYKEKLRQLQIDIDSKNSNCF